MRHFLILISKVQMHFSGFAHLFDVLSMHSLNAIEVKAKPSSSLFHAAQFGFIYFLSSIRYGWNRADVMCGFKID